MDFLVYLEQSNFSIWVRESGSLLAFPGILLLHTYGMAVLVGIVAAIDLRILGVVAPKFRVVLELAAIVVERDAPFPIGRVRELEDSPGTQCRDHAARFVRRHEPSAYLSTRTA